MLFLIPPSEGKTAPITGPKLDLTRLTFPELNPSRKVLIDSLAALSAKSPTKAAELLDLGPTQIDLVELNAHLTSHPCAPAIEVYSGVLYDRLDFPTLSAAAKMRAQTSVLIASALFGFVQLTDPIPAYRLSGSTVLPKIGPLATFWKSDLTPLFDGFSNELVLDMRSGSYEKLAPLTKYSNVIPVKVMTLINGVRKSVTHFNKATKGDLVRASMASARKFPQVAEGLESYFQALGFEATLEISAKGATNLIILTKDH